MRTNLLLLALLFTSMLFTSSIISQTLPMKDGFYIGYHNFLYDPATGWNTQFGRFQSLNVNMMQNYGFHADVDNSDYDGGFLDNINDYKTNVHSFLNTWGSNFSSRNNYIEREKVLRGGYGQRSIYQAEVVSSSVRPRYGYSTNGGYAYSETFNSEFVSGRTSYTDIDPDMAEYYLVSGLYENAEQTDRPSVPTHNNIEFYLSDVKNATTWKWYVLPRMRISTADAFGTSKPVVEIEILNYEGDVLATETIMSNYFVIGGNYNGEYREMFNPTFISGGYINFLGADLNDNNDYDVYGRSNDVLASAVDYRVKWLGEVHVWLDRVVVQDEWAMSLFDPAFDLNLPSPYGFAAKIEEEVDEFATGNDYLGYFYLDEYQYNSLPCIAKVNSIIKSHNANSGLVVETNTALLIRYSGLRNQPTTTELYQYLVSSGAVTDVLFMYVYPFGHIRTSTGPNVYTYFPLPPGVTLPNTTTYPGTVGYHRAGGGSGNKDTYSDSLNILLQNGYTGGRVS